MATLGIQTREAFNKMHSGLLVTDRGGKVLFANNFLEEKRGIPQEQMLGKTPGELWGGKMSKGFYDEMWDTIANQRKIFTGEVKNRVKYRYEYESLNIIPLTDENNVTKYYLQVDPPVYSGLCSKHFSREIKAKRLRACTSCQDFSDLLVSWGETDDSNHWLGEKYQQLITLIDSLFHQEDELNKIEDWHIIGFSQLDSKQFSFFYKKYFNYIFFYFAKRVNSRGEAQELAHEVFYRAFKHLASFKVEDCSYLSYLMTIAHNLLVNHYRHFRATMPIESAYNKFIEPKANQNLQHSELWQYVDQLSPIEAKVLKMFYEQDLSTEKIGYKLDKSANAIKLVLSRARRRLKRKLTA